MSRRKTSVVRVGSVLIGGDEPIRVQSMTTASTVDVPATLKEIQELATAGCEIVRLGVPDKASAEALPQILAETPVPLIADIHFDYRLALMSVAAGVHGLRLNPGNIREAHKVHEVLAACRDTGIPIRIGVNAGSLDRAKYPSPTPEAMVESALQHLRILEDANFFHTKVSLKASSVPMMIEANRLFAKERDYPLHLGVTEAGDFHQSLVKNAIGVGALLAEGIGDTVRISMTAESTDEVQSAYDILQALGLRRHGIELVSCPSCARKEFNVIETVAEFRRRSRHVRAPLTVSILGCVVNGPGEAREADLGLAVGGNGAMLFKQGHMYRRVPKEEMLDALLEELEAMERAYFA